MKSWRAGPCLLTLSLIAAPMSAQTRVCPAGVPLRGDIGVHRVLCTGPAAACTINVRDQQGFHHSFAVEPRVAVLSDAVDDTHPIKVGDTIVSVDGFLITTLEGGRRLANLKPERPVAIVVRRAGRLTGINMTPQAGCGITSLGVRR